MADSKRFTKAARAIMEQLPEADDPEEAPAGSPEIIVRTLGSEAGAVRYLKLTDVA